MEWKYNTSNKWSVDKCAIKYFISIQLSNHKFAPIDLTAYWCSFSCQKYKEPRDIFCEIVSVENTLYPRMLQFWVCNLGCIMIWGCWIVGIAIFCLNVLLHHVMWCLPVPGDYFNVHHKQRNVIRLLKRGVLSTAKIKWTR